jgi:hypothetical protein
MAQPAIFATALAAGSKALKSRARPLVTGWTRSTARGHDAAGETRHGSAERNKPLEGKPWTWQRDETSPRRQVAEQAVEDVRNVEDGT